MNCRTRKTFVRHRILHVSVATSLALATTGRTTIDPPYDKIHIETGGFTRQTCWYDAEENLCLLRAVVATVLSQSSKQNICHNCACTIHDRPKSDTD